MRLDERSSLLLVGKPIAQTLESNKAMEWSPSGATPSKDGDGVDWDGGRLRVCERRSLKTEQWRMAYAHWSDPATFPTGDQLPAHYRAMALPGRKWESVRRYGCMKAIDLESYSKWPESQDRVRETMRAWRAENDSAELARQLPRADAFELFSRLITSLRGMRQKVEDRVDIQGDFRGMLTTEVDEMTSKLEKYWKSGEDDEDYYEQDDDCRGADYYWEQHEDCDY